MNGQCFKMIIAPVMVVIVFCSVAVSQSPEIFGYFESEFDYQRLREQDYNSLAH